MPKSPRRVSELGPDRLTLLCVLVSLALAVAPHLNHLPWWYTLLFLATAGERFSRLQFNRRALPTWLRMLLTTVAIYGVWVSYGSLIGRQAGIALLCVMLALKLLESNRRRDVYLVLTLAYFVVVSQFLFNQSMQMLALMAFVVTVITATLIVVETQPARGQRQTAIGPAGKQPYLALRRAGVMLLQAVPLMLLTFLLFPRLGSPLWGVPEELLAGKTGVSDEMEPGRFLELFIDDSPAFRVEFESALPPPNQRYWRGPVLWDFDGRKWTRPRPFGYTARIQEDKITSPAAYQVMLEPTHAHWLFALDIPVSHPDWAGIAADFTVYRHKPTTSLFRYRMRSDPRYPTDATPSNSLQARALRLPPNRNPRTAALASQWRDQLGNDAIALANRALSMFREQPFEYSYQPPPLLGPDTVDDFLFETRSGYCEYYASAFTVLMRAAGVPARVVTGYQGGEYIASGEYLLVRQSDAHAWSEIWINGQGWQRVDPTSAVAPERVNLGARQIAGGQRGFFEWAWLHDLRNRLDAIHNLWNRWVIDFTSEQQKSLLSSFGINDYQETISLLLLVGLSVLFAVIATFFLWRAQWLGGLDPASRHYARYCRKLARAGLPRRSTEGPKDYRQRALLRFNGKRREIVNITDLYIRLRYAIGSGASDVAELGRRVSQFHPTRGRG